MKKLIISVIFGLFIGLVYILMTLVVCSPLLMLCKFGLVELLTGGTVDFSGVVMCVAGNSAFPSLGTVSVFVIAVQALLCIGAGVLAFLFMKSVLKAHLPNEGYFRHLYEAVFLILLIVPETLVLLSVLFKFPVTAVVIIVAAIAILVCIFSVIMSVKVLPDLMKNGNRRDILKEA